jgi:hypothetical protein
MPERR